MPTPTLTSACEYASGNASNASSATYLRYFMVIPFRLSSTQRFVVAIRRSGGRFSFLSSSGAPTNLNSDRGGKLREDEWLISAILREINHLEGERAHPSIHSEDINLCLNGNG